MNLAPPKPSLPTAPAVLDPAQNKWNGAMLTALISNLTLLATRANGALPKNGSEAMSGTLLLGAANNGAWTPTLTFATPGDLNVVYSSRVGKFQRIDNWVHVNFSIVTTTFTFTTSAGNAQITGLPFTPVAQNAMGYLDYQGIAAAGKTYVGPRIVAPNIEFITGGPGAGRAALAVAGFTTGTNVTLIGEVWYQV